MASANTDEYKKMDQDFEGKMEKCFGPTLLGFPEGNDSSRLYMFSSHEKQFLTLLNPDVPRVSSGYENPFGERSHAYKHMTGKWEVKDIIPKFGNHNVYMMFLYNTETDTWDAVEKQIARNLTEKFGYMYNTEKMDSLGVGDVIRDDVLFKTTSYDEHMNYRFGKNARIMNVTDNSTIEDAIKIRKGWADSVQTVEVDSVVVGINNNDVPLNVYGDDTHYKCFPDIGEELRDCTVCATRRMNKEHQLYDFQPDRLRTITDIDDEYVSSKGSVIYDIDVYYNGSDDFPDNVFFAQLKKYYDLECIYADKVTEVCKRIKDSGSHYTRDVSLYKSKYQNFTNRDYKWKDREKAFDNMKVVFKTCAIISLQEGFKLTGRYGDKGVISKISTAGSKIGETTAAVEYNKIATNILDQLVPDATPEEYAQCAQDVVMTDDCDMPYYYTEDGEKVIADILLNSSGSIRRLNTDQLIEVDINFVGENLQRYIKTLPDNAAKIKVILRFLEILNQDEHDFYLQLWNSYDQDVEVDGHTVEFLNQTARDSLIRDVEQNGFYIVKRPDAQIRYDKIAQLYSEWPWIKPYEAYIDLFGIKGKRIMRPCIIASKYMLLLKQTANKNFSARSTGRTDKRLCPAKSNDKKTNRAPYSRSPIKIGEYHALTAALSPAVFSEYGLYTRNSPIARKSLARILEAPGDPFKIPDLKVQSNWTNVNAQSLNAYLKGIGIGLSFEVEGLVSDVYEDVITEFRSHKATIIDIPSRKRLYDLLFSKYEYFMDTIEVVAQSKEEKIKEAWDWVFAQPDIKEMDLEGITEETMIGYTITPLASEESELEETEDEMEKDPDEEYEDSDKS